MALEFEKLTQDLDTMARKTAEQRNTRRDLLKEQLERLHKYAESWEIIEQTLAQAEELSDPKYYRSARPFDHTEPLDAAIDPATPPELATIFGVDGSQIMPDRHAAFLYYLINIGGIIYHHGSSQTPEQFSVPMLVYPENDYQAANFVMKSAEVSLARDMQEIGTLADVAWDYRRGQHPLIAILDQRLLYWPYASQDATIDKNVRPWLEGMSKIHDSKALLAGYIDRPMTAAAAMLVHSLSSVEESNFDWKSLGRQRAIGGLKDTFLFSQILGPGQRSKLFVGISPPNQRFAEYAPTHEVCFFYLNPGNSGNRIARVDIPRWVAKSQEAVTAVHSLIYSQCQILGGYPYAIARADEMAVVTHNDREELDFMIDIYMERYGVTGRITAKQQGKGWARGGKTRHKRV